MNIHICVFVRKDASIFIWSISRNGMARSDSRYMSNVLIHYQTCLQSGYTILHYHHSEEHSSCAILLPKLGKFDF